MGVITAPWCSPALWPEWIESVLNFIPGVPAILHELSRECLSEYGSWLDSAAG